MLRSITARQFLEWEVYYSLEPFGGLRADYRAASIACVIANVNRAKGQKQFSLQDFLLKFDSEAVPKKQTWQEQKAIAMMWVQAFNVDGKDIE